MSQSSERPLIPKSMRHKRILDVAKEQPEASLEDIADNIPSATAELVENVLDQYGDPAELESEHEAETDLSEGLSQSDLPNPEALTEKQLEVLRLISENPDATQQELATMLGVSPSTVCSHVNSIPGFDWKQRRQIVPMLKKRGDVFESEMASTIEHQASTQQDAMAEISERVSVLEAKLDSIDTVSLSKPMRSNPEIIHKVIHACVKSEVISDEEELEIIKAMV